MGTLVRWAVERIIAALNGGDGWVRFALIIIPIIIAGLVMANLLISLLFLLKFYL